MKTSIIILGIIIIVITLFSVLILLHTIFVGIKGIFCNNKIPLKDNQSLTQPKKSTDLTFLGKSIIRSSSLNPRYKF